MLKLLIFIFQYHIILQIYADNGISWCYIVTSLQDISVGVEKFD